MTDEELATVRASIGSYHNAMKHLDLHAAYLIADHVLHDYGDALLAEVERLQVENAGLAQLGAAKIFYGFPGGEREKRQRGILQAVADGQAVWHDAVGAHCGFCDQLLDGNHAAGCLVTQARALLGED